MGTPLPGTVIAAEITTGNTDNTFSIGDTNLMQGGHHSVTTLAERDAITTERRRLGMTCWVAGTVNTMYQLTTGVTNADWTITQTGTFSVVVEQGTRSDYDQYLQTQIVAETGSRIASDQALIAFVFGSIAVDLTHETGSRIAADIFEQGTRSTEDQYLQTQIIAESGSRIAGEQAIVAFVFGSIAVDLQSETLARIAADQQLLALASQGTIIPPLSSLPDVNIPAPSNNQVLSFDGSRWVAADTPSQVAPGAFTFFLDPTPSGTLGYSTLTSFVTGLPESVNTNTVGAGTPFVSIEDFLEGEFLNRTRIDAGIWEFNTYASVSNSNQPAYIVTDLYLLSINGAQTYLFSGTSSVINSVTPQLVTAITTSGSYFTALTDKLLARYYFLRNSTPSTTASLYHAGSLHDSHFHSPIGYAHNDLGGLQGGSSTANQFYHTTFDQNNALTGTSGYPSVSNPFVTLDSLVIEQGTRSANDQYLLNQVAAEASTRSQAIITEQGTRSDYDQYLLNQIVNLSGSASGSFSSFNAALGAEALARSQADTTEAGTRSAEDQFLQNQITANLAADAQAITTEQGTRSTADQFLQNQITANLTTGAGAIVTEQGTRSSADQVLANQVVNVVNVNLNQQAQLDSLFAALGVSFSGTFAWWMAQIRGGLTDTRLNVINGIVAGLTESTFSWEDFEFYGTGSIGSGGFNKGTAWNGAGIVTASPVPGFVAEEYYVTLPVGPITTIPISAGTGWADNGTIGAETTYGYFGSDALDSYATGTVTAGQINGGSFWAGTATISRI